MANNYGCLGVSPDATSAEIRTAFRRLVKEAHPDRFTQGTPEHAAAEDRLKTLTAAYSALSRPAKRADYDRQLRFDAEVRSRVVPQQRTHSGIAGGSARTVSTPIGQGATAAPVGAGSRQARTETAQHLAARRAHTRAQVERDSRRRRLLDPTDQLRQVLKWGVENVARRRQRQDPALASVSEALGAWARYFYESSAGSGAQGDARLALCLVAAYRELVSRGGFETADLRDVITEATQSLSVHVDLETRTRADVVQVQAARGRTAGSWLLLSLSWAVLLLGTWATAVVVFTWPPEADASPMDSLLFLWVTVVLGAATFGLPAWGLRRLSGFGAPRDAEHKTTRQLDVVDELRLSAAMARYDRART